MDLVPITNYKHKQKERRRGIAVKHVNGIHCHGLAFTQHREVE